MKINEVDSSLEQAAESLSDAVCIDSPVDSGQSLSADGPGFKINCGEELSFTTDAEDARGDIKTVFSDLSLPIVKDVELHNIEGLPTAPKEVASPIKHDNEPYLTNTSLIDKTSTQLDAHSFKSSSSISDVKNASCGSKIDVDEGSSRKLTEESTAAENCTFEEGSITFNGSDMATTTAEVRDKVNSATSTSMHENVGYGNGLSSSDDIQYDAKKSDGEGSAAKFKPLFAPGFLGKHPRKKCIKLGNEVSTELMELTPECHLNNHTFEVAKSLLCENGGLLKEEKPHIMHQNGKASVESDIWKSLENGDSVIEI